MISQSPPPDDVVNDNSTDPATRETVFNENQEEVIDGLVAHREEAIPDVAPPPYSIDVNETVGASDSPESNPLAVDHTTDEKAATPDTNRNPAVSKQGSQSWLSKLCGGK